MRSILLIGLVLASCGQTKPVDRICTTPAAQTSGDWGTCVHRWAYRMAGAIGPASEIADAAVTACADAIAYQVNAAPPSERIELSGQIMDAAPEIARFRVIQARAGHCAVP